MKYYSLWNEFKDNRDTKEVKKDYVTDILIIGGGITGIMLLHSLDNTNLKVMLVERDKCGLGVTSRSTAKITYLQNTNLNILNKKKRLLYLKSQIEAVDRFQKLILKENIDCDFKQVNSYIYTNNKENIKLINEEYIFLRNAKVEVNRVKNIDNMMVKLGLEVRDTYEFNPLKFINYFKNKYFNKIYENSKVEEITFKDNYYLCSVNKRIIKAKYVVIANHYPYFLKTFLMPFKNCIETSFIGAKKVLEFKPISLINIDNPCISKRYYTDGVDNYLIYLFNSKKISDIKSWKDNFLNLQKVNDFDYIWSNNDIITNDYIPFIGRLNKNLFIATGYNTWGFTNSMVASYIIKDLILNNYNPYIKLMKPKRGISLQKIKRFPSDVLGNVKALINAKKNKLNNKQIRYQKIKGKEVVIYKDKKGIEHIVYNKCPHLKCGLIFNEVEEIFECCCHGSRFDIDGKCINGPANYDITYKD